MDDETEFKLITPTSDTLTRARCAHEAARLAFASFVGGSLAGLLAAAVALFALLTLEDIFTCLVSMAVGALAGAGLAIGGIVRMHFNAAFNSIASVESESFLMNKVECLATIVACAGIGSVAGLAYNSQVFDATPVAYKLLAIASILIAVLFGALTAYAWQVSESWRQAAEANFPSRETGNPYQPPLS